MHRKLRQLLGLFVPRGTFFSVTSSLLRPSKYLKSRLIIAYTTYMRDMVGWSIPLASRLLAIIYCVLYVRCVRECFYSQPQFLATPPQSR